MIAYRPHDGGGNIPNRVIDTAMTRHPDGFGLMWRDSDGLHAMAYSPAGRKQFRKELKRLDRTGVEYAAHFRWATSGPKSVEMAHPYVYDDPDPAVGRVAVMHNGVIDISHDRAKESDTSAFVRLVLAQLPSRWWTNPALTYLVGEAIGYSKLTLMTATETWNSHEKRGEWDGGLWYSSNHKPADTSKWTTHNGSGKGVSTSTQYGYWDATQNKWHPYEDAKKPITATALVPYGSVAARSAAAIGLLDQAESVEYDAARDTVRVVDRPRQFRHAGHTLTAIADIALDHDADYEDSVICDTCHTVGTVYVIDGDYYIDMGHVFGRDNADEDSFLEAEVIGA